MANRSMSSILGFVPGSPSAKTSSKSSSKKPTPKKPATKKPAAKPTSEKPAPKPTPKSEPAPKSAPEKPTPVKPAETKPATASKPSEAPTPSSAPTPLTVPMPAPKSEPDKSSPKSTGTNLTDNLRTIYDFSEDSKVKIGTMRFGTLMQLVNDFVIPLIIYNKIFRDKMRAVIKRADELGADRPAS